LGPWGGFIPGSRENRVNLYMLGRLKKRMKAKGCRNLAQGVTDGLQEELEAGDG